MNRKEREPLVLRPFSKPPAGTGIVWEPLWGWKQTLYRCGLFWACSLRPVDSQNKKHVKRVMGRGFQWSSLREVTLKWSCTTEGFPGARTLLWPFVLSRTEAGTSAPHRDAAWRSSGIVKYIMMQAHQFGAGKGKVRWMWQKSATCRWLMQRPWFFLFPDLSRERERRVITHGSAAAYFWTLVSTCEKLMGWSHLVEYLCAYHEDVLVEALWQILSLLPKPSHREFTRHDMRTLPHERINQLSESGCGKWGPSWN